MTGFWASSRAKLRKIKHDHRIVACLSIHIPNLGMYDSVLDKQIPINFREHFEPTPIAWEAREAIEKISSLFHTGQFTQRTCTAFAWEPIYLLPSFKIVAQ